MLSKRRAVLPVQLLLLCACAPAPDQPADIAAQTAPSEQSVDSEIPYDTTTTIEDLMNGIIMPNVEQLWNAVSYVATEEGVTETQPETAEDWAKLRTNALTLIEAGNMLMIPERELLSSNVDPATAAFQLTPDEISQMLAADPEPWRNYARQLQETTRMTLQAIELRDQMGLVEFGAEINEACEGCHAVYWYRPAGMMAPQ